MTQVDIASERQPMLSGLRAFMVLWVGQLVSLLGTGMTRFALTIWVWEQTGEVTSLALMGLFSFTPGIILSPLAGVLVDRWNRKLAMMMSDLAAGASTIVLLMLFMADGLQLWHLYLAVAVASAFEAFQFPAFSAAVTMIVPKKQYARTSALMGLAEAIAGIAAPPLAAVLLVMVDIQGVLMFDILTFTVALFTLAIIYVPQPPPSGDNAESQSGNLWNQILFGFRYIYRRPSLLGLQIMFFFINLTASFTMILMAPMILARTGNDEIALGSVQSAFAAGLLVGGLLITITGGFKRNVHGVLGSMIWVGFFGQLMFGLVHGVFLWALIAFIAALALPVVNSSNQAIWQAKVPPDIQGKVFAVRRLIAQITMPVSMLLAGPLADQIFEPGMQEGGSLAAIFAGFILPGAGGGMALMLVLIGVFAVIISASGYAVPAIHNAESILPDHDAT